MAYQPKSYRKFLAGSVSAALVASAVGPVVANAASFSDVNPNDSHAADISALVEKGYITGYPDGTFKPYDNVTRGQVAKIFARILKDQGFQVPADKKAFDDVPVDSQDKELVEAAAIVKAAGVMTGSEGKLNPYQPITRQQMAKVLVEAFKLTKPADFTSKITDLDKADAWARDYIQTLEANHVTVVTEYKPTDSVTRAAFASFVKRALDVSAVNPKVESIKAINATTVEVTFKDAIENVASLHFSIEGLEVKNAALKQNNDKVVVLTTSEQEGGKQYTVKLDGEELGKFTGISAVIPTSITLETNSVQGKIGKEVTLRANIGQKVAGVPVTFNIDASATSLNKDRVVEVYTNADGIAEYTYTQYAAGVDTVSVYPTGAASTRDIASVYWGVEPILTLTADKKETVANKDVVTYTATLLDPVSGKPLANKILNVTLAENINTTTKDDSFAVVTDAETGKSVTPYQSATGEEELQVTTDRNGKATFTVSGNNTQATPIVFLDVPAATGDANSWIYGDSDNRLDARELQVKGDTVVFEGVQKNYQLSFDVTKDVEAAVHYKYDYTLTVLDKDGKPYAGGTVWVGLDELLDKNFSTNTKAVLEDADGNQGTTLPVTLDSKGQATISVVSDTENDTATPVAWIDLNDEGAQQGELEAGEPYAKGGSVTFRKEIANGAKLAVTSAGDTGVHGVYVHDAATTALVNPEFELQLLNQSGKLTNTDHFKRVTYTVKNTGTNPVKVVFKSNNVDFDNYSEGVQEVTIAAGNSYTLAGNVYNNAAVSDNRAQLEIVARTKGKLEVKASGTTTDDLYVAGQPQTVEWVDASEHTSGELTGEVVGYYTGSDATDAGYVVVKVDGTSQYRWFKYQGNDNFYVGTSTDFAKLTKLDEAAFEKAISTGDRITYDPDNTPNPDVRLINADNSKDDDQVDVYVAPPTPADHIVSAVGTDTDHDGFYDQVTVTFSGNVNASTVEIGDFAIPGATVTTVNSTGNQVVTVTLTDSVLPVSAAFPTVTVSNVSLADGTRINGESQVATDDVAPYILNATTAQTNATAQLTANGGGVINLAINTAGPLGHTMDGAFGNNLQYQIIDSGAGGLNVSYAAGLLTIDLGGTNPTVAQVIAAINAEGTFRATLPATTNAADTFTAAEVMPPANFTGGQDVVTVDFSEAVNAATLDLAAADNNFDLAGGAFTGTTAVVDANTVTITITDAAAQVKGDTITITAGTISDGNANAAGTAGTVVNPNRTIN